MACDVVVSVRAKTLEELHERAVLAAPEADLVELRIDALAAEQRSASDCARAAEAIADACARPIVVACHGPEAFGAFLGSSAERIESLRPWLRSASWVDLDLDTVGNCGPLPAGVRRVVSEHRREGGAARAGARMRALLDRCGPHDRAKFVPQAHNGQTGLELLEALRGVEDSRLVAFAAGIHGRTTRVLAPIFGSRAVYACADREAATAPGQLSVEALRAAWPRAGVSTSTRIAAVIGREIAHSRSPAVHTHGLRELGLDAVFTRFDVDDFNAAFELLRRWEAVIGLAVTAPFKSDAVRVASESSATVRRVGAANTLRWRGSDWIADNTDVDAVEELANADGRRSSRSLVCGAGGAARAALGALVAEGRSAAICARRSSAASELATEFGADVVDWERVDLEDFDLVVNATPLGGPSAPGEMPPLPDPWPSGVALIESNYGAGPTPLVRRARAVGAPVADGGAWFLAQARAQFELLFDAPAPAEAMQAAFEGQECEW